MAGERLSKLTIEASLHLSDGIRGNQTFLVRFFLAGVWIDYMRGPYTSRRQFVVPDPDDVGRDYVKQAVDNLLALVKLDIQSRGLPYVVSATRDLGNNPANNQPRIQFDIEATQYDTVLNLDFENYDATGSPSGWTVVQKLTSLQPLTVIQSITPAGVFGSATGAIRLVALTPNHYPISYLWADGFNEPDRTKLLAGTYLCTVRDADGVSTLVTCVVKSDPQLLVLVQQTEDSIALVVSGGVAPYRVAWDDGTTTLVRTRLSSGTYEGPVRDANGATQRVHVVLAPNRCYYSQNPIRLPLDAGQAYRDDPSTKPNLSFVAQVWVEKDYLSGSYEQAGPDLEQPADLQGRTVFNVQALLDAYVQEHLPALDGPLATVAAGAFKRFYLKSAERYGTPPVTAGLSTARVNYVLRGGLSPYEAASDSWPTYQQTIKPFLTWDPDFQKVLPQQPAYLYYQHVAPGATAQVWVRVRHLDGTSSQSTVALLKDVRRWEVYCLAVGPAMLGLTGPEVAGYDVWVTNDAGVVLSQVRRFTLERAFYPQQRFFLYSNSLGGANVLAALGAAKQTLEVAVEQVERPVFDAELGDVVTLDRLGMPTVSVETGPRLRKQVQADQELLLSRRVVLVKDGRTWPGVVNKATYKVKDENEGLASLAFDFILPKQRHFSPRLPVLVTGQAPTPVAGGEGATP
jgi:hypothetical protein